MMKGTPYIYQGEEIGMTNYPIADISEADDIETINMYHERLAEGYSKESLLASINAKGRDNARRPVQWDSSNQAGFTNGTPWLAVHPNYQTINVADSLADEDSIFYTYQKLIQLRKEHPIIVYGSYTLLLEEDPVIFAYLREYEGKRWLVCANFSEEVQKLQLEVDETESKPIIQNYQRDFYDLSELILEPYETFVVELD